jgi:tRNA(Ile2) C34 agmatinyltransferase TiaS
MKNEEGKFVCPKCGLVLNSKGNLTLHLRSPAAGYRAAHHLADGLANNGGIPRKRREGNKEPS